MVGAEDCRGRASHRLLYPLGLAIVKLWFPYFGTRSDRPKHRVGKKSAAKVLLFSDPAQDMCPEFVRKLSDHQYTKKNSTTYVVLLLADN